jgi:hypothetical protein
MAEIVDRADSPQRPTARRPAAAKALFQAPASDGPAYHALVIGVSRYRHLPGGGGKTSTNPLAAGLSQLSSAAASALRVATWLRDRYEPPDVGRGSIRLLLSPVEGELPEGVSVPPATSARVESALAAWRRAVRTHAENVALLYVAGHGIQMMMDGGILLLEDFANPKATTPLKGAIDIQSVRRGIVSDPTQPDTYTPRLQFYFYDACRVRLPDTVRYDSLDAGITLDAPQGESPEASWVCFGSRPRDFAFADPRRRATLYSQAFVECLENRALTQSDGRTVRLNELQSALRSYIHELGQQFGEDQQAEYGGWGNTFVPIHRRPELRVAQDIESPEDRKRPMRLVRFRVSPRLPVFARAGDAMMGENTVGQRAIEMPVGTNYEAVVPLPWGGGEHIEAFDVPADDDGQLYVTVHVPDPLLTLPPPVRAVPGHGPGDAAEDRCVVRFLTWQSGAFRIDESPPRVVVYEQLETGDIRLTLSLQHELRSYEIRDKLFVLDLRRPLPFIQVDSAKGPSALTALPLAGGDAATCEAILRYGDRGVVVMARPGGKQSNTVAGYLRTGRADRALTAMAVDAAQLLKLKMADPIGAAIGGYALLKLQDLKQVRNWCDNLANWFPALADGAVIAGAVVARRGQPEVAHRWLSLAAERGIPAFSEGLSLLVSEAQSLGSVAALGPVADLALSADFSALCTTLRTTPHDISVKDGWHEVVPREDRALPDVNPL